MDCLSDCLSDRLTTTTGDADGVRRRDNDDDDNDEDEDATTFEREWNVVVGTRWTTESFSGGERHLV